MNHKAEFTTQGMIFAILTVGLVLGVFSAWISLQSNYDTTGFDASQIDAYNNVDNLTNTLQIVSNKVDTVTVDSSWFDYFSGIFSKLLQPFQFVYRTFSYLISIANQASDMFQLLPVFREYFTAIILTAVIVGIVLYKMHLGKSK